MYKSAVYLPHEILSRICPLHCLKNLYRESAYLFTSGRKSWNAKASRAVGSIMAKNADKNVPCHRVVKSDGSIGMYNGLRGKSKEAILKKEGVKFNDYGKVVLR